MSGLRPDPQSPRPHADANPSHSRLREHDHRGEEQTAQDRAPRRAPHPPTLHKPSCGGTGGTTRSIPTSTSPWSRWVSSTAATRRSSSPSATSKPAPGSSSPSGAVLRQRRLARLRPARPQPHPLEDAARRLQTDTQHRDAHHPTRVLAIPGRLVNRSGHHVLRLGARWPWQAPFNRALDQLRALNGSPRERAINPIGSVDAAFLRKAGRLRRRAHGVVL